MRPKDSIGWLGVASFLASFFVSNRVSNILGLLGIGLLFAGALLGSRKWFIVLGVVLLMIGAMYLLMAHKD
jgi:hypothetical protein